MAINIVLIAREKHNDIFIIMPAPEHILQKIKLLQKLATSPNKNESETATAMVDKLVAKYNISVEELNSIADKAPAYGNDEKLFETSFIVGWMTQLALAIGMKYDCQIVQEVISPISEGDTHYNYFVYGADEDVLIVKFVWGALSSKVEELVLERCGARGPIYAQSYTEGVVQSIKLNLQFEDLDLPLIKKDTLVRETDEEIKPDAMTTPVTVEKEKPTENKSVVTGDLIKDIMAYFKGLEDGKNIKLQSVLNAYFTKIQEEEQNEQSISPQAPPS